MKNKIEKLINQYLEETLDTTDEFSHGDAITRMTAYVRVVKDLKKIIKEEEAYKEEPKLYRPKKNESRSTRLLCPSCESGFLRIKPDKDEPELIYSTFNTIKRVDHIPYCECCKKQYMVSIRQEDLKITLTPYEEERRYE